MRFLWEILREALSPIVIVSGVIVGQVQERQLHINHFVVGFQKYWEYPEDNGSGSKDNGSSLTCLITAQVSS